VGHHGPMTSMGVPRNQQLPWDELQVMARACGHDFLNMPEKDDVVTWHHEMALLSGVNYTGVTEAV